MLISQFNDNPGATNLYGPAYPLPMAISGMNSNWYRGYGDPPPQTGWDEIFVCRHLRRSWPEFWKHFQYYG